MKLLRDVVNIFGDLLIRVLPLKGRGGTYKFAFIVHPRSRNDLERKFSFFKYLPDNLVYAFTKYCWPLTISKITGLKSSKDGRDIEGYVISILPTAHQMIENRKLTLKHIIQACKLAEKRGVKIVGLGGLTSSLSKGGLDLINKVNVNITTGHAYTSYNVTQNIIKLVDVMSLNKEKIRIGIVGAAGSIGSTSAKVLVRYGFKHYVLVDLERKKQNCVELTQELRGVCSDLDIVVSHQIEDIITCDIIVAATNAPEAIIQSKDLKWGAIVVDDAQPSDVHSDVFSRKDILVIEAGVTHTPQVMNNFNFGLKDRFDNFCCLAEVLILAANEWEGHFVINRASLDLVDNISELGKRLGFKIGQFQNFKERISNEKISFVRNCIKQNEFTS